MLKSGERRSSRAFTIFLVSQRIGMRGVQGSGSKLGITVNRRVGNAIVRNRIKRRVREWFRQARLWLPGERDIVVIARSAASELSHAAITAMLDELAQRPDTIGIEQMVVGSR